MVNLNVNIQGKFSTLIQKGCLAMAYAYRYAGPERTLRIWS